VAIYTFFLGRDDAAAATFEAFDLAGDDHAAEMAASVLSGHSSAEHVSIWQDDRPLGQISRSDIHLPLLARQG
jgi:hypothetical protein